MLLKYLFYFQEKRRFFAFYELGMDFAIMISNSMLKSLEDLPISFLVGVILIFGFFVGRSMKRFHMPMIIGYMLTGVVLGPSGFNITDGKMQANLSFITEITLGLVAFNIGLELIIRELKVFGLGIISIIVSESFCAFLFVFLGMYAFTGNLALSLAFGAMAPASAPAGTVAVIQEYKTTGRLTKALYAVVGFDDGLAIIIFGFVLAFLNHLLNLENGGSGISVWYILGRPFFEIFLSVFLSSILSWIFCKLLHIISDVRDILILIFGFIMVGNSLCYFFQLSLILTNMLIGLFIGNTQGKEIREKIEDPLLGVMPLLYILFFVLAGAHLRLEKIGDFSYLALIYVIGRSLGLIGGAWLGATIGRAEKKIKRYIGLGILSQAGVAIGLSLILQQDLKGKGKILDFPNSLESTVGDFIGNNVLLTIVITSIFFELIGPIFTKIALEKAGELRPLRQEDLRFYREMIKKPQEIAAFSIVDKLMKTSDEHKSKDDIPS